MMLLSILIQLIISLLLSVVIALPLAGSLYVLSKRKRTRKVIFGLISPFVFMFSFYFMCLISGLICATAFKTGCGMDGYWHTELPNGYVIESFEDEFNSEYLTGNIIKDEKLIVEWVTKVKISGDTIYGERYDVNEAPGSEYYFSIDTKTDKLDQYTSLNEEQRYKPNIITSLTDIESFYYHSWKWVIPLGVTAFVISCGLVFLLWLFIVKSNSVKRLSKEGGKR